MWRHPLFWRQLVGILEFLSLPQAPTMSSRAMDGLHGLKRTRRSRSMLMVEANSKENGPSSLPTRARKSSVQQDCSVGLKQEARSLFPRESCNKPGWGVFPKLSPHIKPTQTPDFPRPTCSTLSTNRPEVLYGRSRGKTWQEALGEFMRGFCDA